MQHATLSLRRSMRLVALVQATVSGDYSSAATAQTAENKPPASALKLQVPSPDWRDRIIYFLMTDRYADGEPSNNDQGANAFNVNSNTKYSVSSAWPAPTVSLAVTPTIIPPRRPTQFAQAR